MIPLKFVCDHEDNNGRRLFSRFNFQVLRNNFVSKLNLIETADTLSFVEEEVCMQAYIFGYDDDGGGGGDNQFVQATNFIYFKLFSHLLFTHACALLTYHVE